MKEFLMLIREDLDNYGKMTPQQMQEDIERHVKWVETLVQQGHFKGGNPLTPTGKYIKSSERMITDGPYIEAKEGVSGFYFLLAPSLEEATRIARGCPSLDYGGMVEIREVILTE